MVIFYFPHSSYIYYLEFLHKGVAPTLSFIQPYHLFIHHGILDIYCLDYNAILSFSWLLKLFQLWPLGALSGWLLYPYDILPSLSSFFFFGTSFLAVNNAPDSSCISLAWP